MRSIIEAAWNNRALLQEKETIKTIDKVIEDLDKGLLRVAEPGENNSWVVNEWVKKAVVMYFPIRQMETIEVGPFEFHDKMALKTNYKELGVRVVPPAVARYGAYISKGVILMPSYVNIGAFVDEPLQAAPVIIEDGAFIGSRCIVVEGVRVGKEAVLGANVVLTKSTKIIDVTNEKPVEHIGYVPERSVVIPGSYTKNFPAGDFQVPCALIIGLRKESTDLKTSLNDALREHNVAV
ncbi:MAG: 2,3,4,5-tetrahydropyridine-2,6-dicarboxylate N-succinyltransferase [Flavobacteriia bacterium]|nr:2,3,4,5-tetrahydropyridine-2,6-dicarboxylate N-succinyltransferase [Flavobacteriia bacterium]